MIVYINTNSNSIPMRLTRHKGSMYMYLDDVISLSSSKAKLRPSTENIEKVYDIVGEENFSKLEYGSMRIPLPCISYNGLKKLIDYSDIEDYLHKDDLVIIYDYITKFKRNINKALNAELQNEKMTVVTKNEITNTYLNDKLREMEHHINIIKSHLDTVIKIQEELINNN